MNSKSPKLKIRWTAYSFMISGYRIPNLELTPEQIFPIQYINTPTVPGTPVATPMLRNGIDIAKVPSSPYILKNLPPKAQETYVVYTKIQILSFHGNRPLGQFNQTSWEPQKDPSSPLIALPRHKWDENQLAISTGPEPKWIDFVVNNLDEGSHPFHLVRPPIIHTSNQLTNPARPPLLRPNNPATWVLGLLQPLLRSLPTWFRVRT